MIILLMPKSLCTGRSVAEAKSFYIEYGIFLEPNTKDEWELMSTPDGP